MVRIWSILFCMLLWVNGSAFAGAKEVVTTGKYVMGDLDTKTKAKNFALLDAKKMAMEKSGTYLRSVSEVKGLHLTKDEVYSLAAGVMSVEILDETWDMQGQNPVVTITIKAIIDTSGLDEEVKALRAGNFEGKFRTEMEKTGGHTAWQVDSKVSIMGSFLKDEITVTGVNTLVNPGGLMEVQVMGRNNASWYKKLEYRIEWFDKNGFLIKTVMSRWTGFPAYGDSDFGFRAVSPTTTATDFRIKIREED